MALTMEAPATLEGHEETSQDEAQAIEQTTEATVQVDDDQAKTDDEPEAETEQPETNEPAAVNDDEKRFWAEIGTLGKITDCSENIEECERRINELKEEIKVEKEMLKGEQHRLQKLARELREIKAGHPLPVDPNAKKEEEKPSEPEAESDDGQTDDSWRDKPTGELLDGVNGFGAKKRDALIDVAPTAGDLEDLRGQASKAHKSFREVLPNGFGQKLADAIEDRLIDHVAKSAPPAEQQATAERIAEREREQIEQSQSEGEEPPGETDDDTDDDQYEDVDDEDVL